VVITLVTLCIVTSGHHTGGTEFLVDTSSHSSLIQRLPI